MGIVGRFGMCSRLWLMKDCLHRLPKTGDVFLIWSYQYSGEGGDSSTRLNNGEFPAAISSIFLSVIGGSPFNET
jgi:hypothetical protein